jgi:maltose alpha-D-glucosyltransferase / alpha-amylase
MTSLLTQDPLWYKDAVIYEVHVRAFQDSNSDGIGDFRGLTSRLDHLQELGVTAVWLLPFYPSPLRDDGYDIADYTSVHPAYGSIDDFVEFLGEAHRLGLRVITELVINHTSDQHPWFQRARRSPSGSPERDFYVWSDSPDKYRQARIIFQDTETSNWSWDPVARAYFWHRFFSHQPDLNYDNPQVEEALRSVLDFWLDLGVDGLRLDAVPYLYEREGTMCENLPETHQQLKDLRRHLSERYQERILLAEANQWPEDAAAYFGDGDECHMAFHFPLMPRLFMSIQMENRFPVVDILEQTPAIPENTQWAIFLRNHDELTLEMVTEEERDFMYRTYARDRRARLNLGIRRRLGPLLDNSRRRIELMNALLLSLPGTPVLYYGDEIGMGDNIYLGDRNGVRTPMQWSSDRNAGFSAANPQSLYLPVIIDPEYHYETVNVEAQRSNPSSLLWWTRRIVALRRRHQVFGRGDIEFLHPENPRVLAFLRRYGEETVVVVANLSRFSQFVELDLTAFGGSVPVELFGRTEFPRIGEGPWVITLGPHSFYWFELVPSFEPITATGEAVPELTIRGPLESLFEERTGFPLALLRYARKRAWFRSRLRRAVGARIPEVVPLGVDGQNSWLGMLAVDYSEGEPERYVIPLAVVPDEPNPPPDRPAIAHLRLDDGMATVIDGLWDPQLRAGTLRLMAEGGRRHGASAALAGTPGEGIDADRVTAALEEQVYMHDSPEGHTNVVFGGGLAVKLFRRTEPGVHPDLELRRFLTERTAFHALPAVLGSLDYRDGPEEASTVALLQEYVPHEGTAWELLTDSLGLFYDELAAALVEFRHRPPVRRHPLRLIGATPPAWLAERIDTDLQVGEALGRLTAELHRALASDLEDPDFRPEPLTALYRRSLAQSYRASIRQTLAMARRRAPELPPAVAESVTALCEREEAILTVARSVTDERVGGMRIRCHGDYRLDEILSTGRDFMPFDFAGDTSEPLSQRRLKESPARDIADLLRSLHYAAFSTLLAEVERGAIAPEAVSEYEPWSRAWWSWVSSAFLRTYLEESDGQLLPLDTEQLILLLDATMIEKAVRELSWELNNRTHLVPVAAAGVREALGDPVVLGAV